jgi:hypothetical protein
VINIRHQWLVNQADPPKAIEAMPFLVAVQCISTARYRYSSATVGQRV